jgi:hypothetical protein
MPLAHGCAIKNVTVPRAVGGQAIARACAGQGECQKEQKYGLFESGSETIHAAPRGQGVSIQPLLKHSLREAD